MEDTKSRPTGDAAKREAFRQALHSWANTRRATAEDRDGLVTGALAAGLSKEEVHVITGLGRSTIDRIVKTHDRLRQSITEGEQALASDAPMVTIDDILNTNGGTQ